MIEDRLRCPGCHAARLEQHSGLFQCGQCSRTFPCVSGIPKLVVEESVGEERQDATVESV